jgi:hypothetical protein
MKKELGPISVNRKSGNEKFHRDGKSLGFDLLGFWQWATSDLLSNATRGILAEYIVAHAVGDSDTARTEWNPFDAIAENRVRIEVKSAAYIQSWHQDKYSRITFSTRPTLAWDSRTNLLTTERKRQSDVYVFCLLDHKDQSTVDPLNLSQWRFFVVSTEKLNAELGEQKSLGLNRLLQIKAEETEYNQLAKAVARAFSPSSLS